MLRLCLSASLLLAIPSAASALRPTDDLGSRIQLASGDVARLQVDVALRAPKDRPEWDDFRDEIGGSWQAMWDGATHMPLRIWGSGIEAPKSERSAADAERFARAFLAKHVALLAPGSSPDDFVLASNVLSNGVRTVGFYQTKGGVRVARGQVSFRFKKDRLIAIGSEAFPSLSVELASSRISDQAAMQAALRWVDGRVERVEEPVVRAVVLADGRVMAAHVVPVIVWTKDPIGKWEIDVEAASGRAFAKRQMLMFGAGTLLYHAPIRYPAAGYQDVPAKTAAITVDGVAARTADDGSITFTATTAQIGTSVSGPLVDVTQDGGGAPATAVLPLADGGSAIWDESRDELKNAQVSAFVAARSARDFVKALIPNAQVAGVQLPVIVNIQDVCNAFSDGLSINFFRSGSGCENTALLPDVVRHEYGHTVHFHAIIPGVGDFESALSEGGADYLAATMVNDHGMGRGFFFTDDPLRDLDPVGGERVWPRDIDFDPHETGLIFAGAMWDLRKLLIEKYGDRGVQMTDLLWYGVFERATDIPTSYVEVLVGNDDDGNLANGTPDMCDITDVFRAHGLANALDAGLDVGALSFDGSTVSIPVTERGLCPGFSITGANVIWQPRGQPSTTVPMTKADGLYTASIPQQADGTVLQYRVQLDVENGETLSYPDNPADPFYEVYVGNLTPIYCTDFETDPAEQGWTHEMIQGSGMRARDEWEWGVINSDPSSGDPSRAYSGDYVIGNDLGISERAFGTYQRNKIEEMRSPTVDVTGHQKVRLQYHRWLTMEDGDFDQAQIFVNGDLAWGNYASPDGMGGTDHVDREWRFQDIDLTDFAAQNAGQIQIAYRLTSDDGFQLGGWTIDDFCIMAYDAPPACGDGKTDPGEACDDGNTNGGDGCEADCTMTPAAVCGNGVVEAGEACDDGNAAAGDGCDPGCIVGPIVEGPKLIDDEGGCGCTSSRSGGEGLLGLLSIGLFVAIRRRAS